MPCSAAATAFAGRYLLAASFLLVLTSCEPQRATSPGQVTGSQPAVAQVVSADPGGPYSGVEGSPIAFDGTGSQGNGLRYNWDFGDGTARDTTATPLHTYADNKIFTVKLFVTDASGVKSTTVQTTATVANAPPVVADLEAPALAPRAGLAVMLSTSFTDAGRADKHTGTFMWGDGKSSSANVKEAGGRGTVSGSHSYAAAGTYTVSLRVVDNNGAAGTVTIVLEVGAKNQPPKAAVGGPYMGVEGTSVSFDGSGSTDPDGDALTYEWDFGDGSPRDTGVSPTHVYADDKTYTVKLVAIDGYGAESATSQTSVTIANAAPEIVSFAGPVAAPVAGTATTVQATFTDAGIRDTHSAAIDWGDATSSSAAIVKFPGGGTVTGSHKYAASGHYVVRLTLKDNGGGADTATINLGVVAPGSSVPAGALIRDYFGRTVSNGWGEADYGGPWLTDINPAGHSVDGSVAKYVASASFATANATAQVATYAGDVRGLVRWSVDKLPGAGGYITVQVYARRDDSAGRGDGNYYYRFRHRLLADGSMTVNVQQAVNDTATFVGGQANIRTAPASTYREGDWYWMRWECVGPSTATDLRLRVWKDGDAEPNGWQLEILDHNEPRLAATGTSGLRYQSYLAPADGWPVTFSFDDFNFERYE